MKPPIEQAKNHILNILRQAGSETKIIVYPCYSRDAADYHNALALPEVIAAFERRSIQPRVELVDRQKTPDIAIATIEDVTSGRLDHILKP